MTNPVAIALLSNDLMFSSTVGGAAAANGAKLHVISSLGELAKLGASQSLALVLFDLATIDAEPSAVVAEASKLSPAPAVVAYGPHVHAEKLDLARSAGCNEVLTRGQFHSQMHAVIARYVSPSK